MIPSTLTLADLQQHQPIRYGRYLPYRESDMAFYVGLYDKSQFESFADFGAFCCKTHKIQKLWYRDGDSAHAFQHYTDSRRDERAKFVQWMAAADQEDNDKLRHSKKDLTVSLRVIFGGSPIHWLEAGMISESYYNRGGRELTLKGLGEKYFIDLFFTKIESKRPHANFPGMK